MLGPLWTIPSWKTANPGARSTTEIAAGVGGNRNSTHNTLTTLAGIGAVTSERLTGAVDPARPTAWKRDKTIVHELVAVLVRSILMGWLLDFGGAPKLESEPLSAQRVQQFAESTHPRRHNRLSSKGHPALSLDASGEYLAGESESPVHGDLPRSEQLRAD